MTRLMAFILGLLIILILVRHSPAMPRPTKRPPEHFTFSPASIRGDIKIYRVPLPTPLFVKKEKNRLPALPLLGKRNHSEESTSSESSNPKTPINLTLGYHDRVSTWAHQYASYVNQLTTKIREHDQWMCHVVCYITDERSAGEGWEDADIDNAQTVYVMMQELSYKAQFPITKLLSGSLKLAIAPDEAGEYCHVNFEKVFDRDHEADDEDEEEKLYE